MCVCVVTNTSEDWLFDWWIGLDGFIVCECECDGTSDGKLEMSGSEGGQEKHSHIDWHPFCQSWNSNRLTS